MCVHAWGTCACVRAWRACAVWRWYTHIGWECRVCLIHTWHLKQRREETARASVDAFYRSMTYNLRYIPWHTTTLDTYSVHAHSLPKCVWTRVRRWRSCACPLQVCPDQVPTIEAIDFVTSLDNWRGSLKNISNDCVLSWVNPQFEHCKLQLSLACSVWPRIRISRLIPFRNTGEGTQHVTSSSRYHKLVTFTSKNERDCRVPLSTLSQSLCSSSYWCTCRTPTCQWSSQTLAIEIRNNNWEIHCGTCITVPTGFRVEKEDVHGKNDERDTSWPMTEIIRVCLSSNTTYVIRVLKMMRHCVTRRVLKIQFFLQESSHESRFPTSYL